MGLQTEVAKKIVKQDTNYTCFFHRKKRAKALQKIICSVRMQELKRSCLEI